MMKQVIILLSIAIFCALTACRNKKTETVQPEQTFSISDKLTVGQLEEYVSAALNQNTPKVELSSSVGKLPNLSLEIQPNSFEGPNKLKISLADIKNNKLGDDFKALTPLIQIESEQNISRNGLMLTIPIKLPQGHFAAAFAVGDDGSLHILPLLNLLDNQIQTFLFDLNYQEASAKNMRITRISTYANITKLIVFAVEQDRLSSIVGSSKYTPGVDDWEFANYGSSYTRGGNCFGMAVTSLWYYLFERPNSMNLFGKKDLGLFVEAGGKQVNQFAPTPVTKDALWFDNKFGIRLATVVQKHQLVDEINKIRENYENIVSKSIDAIHDRNMYNLVSYHYLVSDEPLLLGCYGNGGAHGVLVIGKQKDKLILSDPNTPGIVRQILYNSIAGFEKYDSKLKANVSDAKFSKFYVLPWRGVVKMKNIKVAWQQVKDGTIGKDIFEELSYSLVQEGKTTSLSPKEVNEISSAFSLFSTADRVHLFRQDGVEVLPDERKYFRLGPDVTQIGILALKGTIVGGKTEYDWLDFQWFKVNSKIPSNPQDTTTTAFDASKISGTYVLSSITQRPITEIVDIAPYDGSEVRYSGEIAVAANGGGYVGDQITLRGEYMTRYRRGTKESYSKLLIDRKLFAQGKSDSTIVFFNGFAINKARDESMYDKCACAPCGISPNYCSRLPAGHYYGEIPNHVYTYYGKYRPVIVFIDNDTFVANLHFGQEVWKRK